MFSAEELVALKSEIENDPAAIGYPSFAGLSGDDLDAALATTARRLVELQPVANPTPQGTVPAPIDVNAAMALVSAVELKQIDNDTLDRFASAADAGDMAKVWRIFSLLVAKQILVASKAALQGYLERTIADPTWRATVPGPSRATIVCRSVSGQGRDEVPGMGSSHVRTILGL